MVSKILNFLTMSFAVLRVLFIGLKVLLRIGWTASVRVFQLFQFVFYLLFRPVFITKLFTREEKHYDASEPTEFEMVDMKGTHYYNWDGSDALSTDDEDESCWSGW